MPIGTEKGLTGTGDEKRSNFENCLFFANKMSLVPKMIKLFNFKMINSAQLYLSMAK